MTHTRYTCDKCRREITQGRVMLAVQMPSDRDFRDADLCAPCGRAFAEWLATGPAGADAAEIDVQFTADEAPVVIHDTDLLRLAGLRRRVAEMTLAELRAVVGVVLVLGVVYTLKVLDVILGLTRGGPANATQTLATQSYERSFVDFKFGEGAAFSNILILISLVFAVVYLRSTRRAVDE